MDFMDYQNKLKQKIDIKTKEYNESKSILNSALKGSVRSREATITRLDLSLIAGCYRQVIELQTLIEIYNENFEPEVKIKGLSKALNDLEEMLNPFSES